MLSLNVCDSILLLTDSLLSISFGSKLGFSGMELMIFLGIFTDSMEDDCLVLGVAKEKSLAGRLEHSNFSILKSTIPLLTQCKSSFLFGLFTIFY